MKNAVSRLFRLRKPLDGCKLAIITGCGHTGTTLLARMMGVHSKIYNPPYETNIFLAYNVLKWEKLLKLQFSNAKKNKRECSILLEKTPRHIWHVDYINRIVPGVKVILMTRNGRDVVASLYERTGDIDSSILRYKDDSFLTIRQLNNQSSLLIRYEDLIANSSFELTRIMNHIGLEFEESMLNYHETDVNWYNQESVERGGPRDEGEEHLKLRNWQVNQPIFSQSKKWNERIPKKHWSKLDSFFEDDGDEIMKNLGYF
tara:strand:- start:142 stop:918 length:777 start_codon:yes stop_codon:yes gene_type:complete